MPKTKKHTLPPEEQQTGTYVRKDHSFLDEKITFDRFVRGLLLVIGVVGLYYLLNALSGVLLPFFVAWLLAYMMYPLIIFWKSATIRIYKNEKGVRRGEHLFVL